MSVYPDIDSRPWGEVPTERPGIAFVPVGTFRMGQDRHYRFGANWRHPYGRGSWTKGLDEHPIVHVAYADAFENVLTRNKRCEEK